jgi:hypothetical protein
LTLPVVDNLSHKCFKWEKVVHVFVYDGMGLNSNVLASVEMTDINVRVIWRTLPPIYMADYSCASVALPAGCQFQKWLCTPHVAWKLWSFCPFLHYSIRFLLGDYIETASVRFVYLCFVRRVFRCRSSLNCT